MVNYVVDEKKRICKCAIVVKKKSNGKVYTYAFRGKAKCSPQDTFDAALGSNIAHIRAMIKLKKWEQKGYTATVNFCDQASNYYEAQKQKMTERLDKTSKNLTRLEGELADLVKVD